MAKTRSTELRDYIIYAVLVLVAFSACAPLALFVPDTSWKEGPEILPEPTTVAELPPGAKGAILDPAYFASQFAIIVGAYVGTVVLVCILILTVGRRLRHSTQESPGTLKMEILKPVPLNKPSTDNPWGPSPVTPVQASPRWPAKRDEEAWPATAKHQYQTSVQSVVTFDESVIEEDRLKNEMEMDRLYAAVAQHEAQRERASNYAASVPSEPAPPRSPLAQHPPELQHLRYGPSHASTDSTRHLISQAPPTDEPSQTPSRSSTKSPRRLHKASPVHPSGVPSRTSSHSSYASYSRKKPASVRDLQISAPIPIPDWEDGMSIRSNGPETAPAHQETFGAVQLEGGRRFHFAPSVHSARSVASSIGPSPAPTPRTATFGIPPPPPSIREQRSREEALLQYQQQQHEQRLRLQQSGPTPLSPRSPREQAWMQERQAREQREQPPLPASRSPHARRGHEASESGRHAPPPPRYPEAELRSPTSPTESEFQGFNFQLDAASTRSNSPPPPSPSIADSKRSAGAASARTNRPAPLPLRGADGSASQSKTSLALRTAATLPFRALRSPNTQRPPSIIKATEVERPERSNHRRNNPNNLLSPHTAVPATPYSPYMPMTPLTPITPSRLITREERKRMKREEGRRVLTAADAVPEEDEMWG